VVGLDIGSGVAVVVGLEEVELFLVLV